MVAEFIGAVFLECLMGRLNALPTVRRSKDLHVRLPGGLCNRFPNLFHHRVMQSVLDFVNQYHAAWSMDRGLPATKPTSIAKLFATDAAVRAASQAVLIHGNRGYSNEYPVERYYRDIKGLQIYEGTSHIQRIIIARELVGRGEQGTG